MAWNQRENDSLIHVQFVGTHMVVSTRPYSNAHSHTPFCKYFSYWNKELFFPDSRSQQIRIKHDTLAVPLIFLPPCYGSLKPLWNPKNRWFCHFCDKIDMQVPCTLTHPQMRFRPSPFPNLAKHFNRVWASSRTATSNSPSSFPTMSTLSTDKEPVSTQNETTHKTHHPLQVHSLFPFRSVLPIFLV